MTQLRLVVYDINTGNRLYDCSYNGSFIEPTVQQLHDSILDLQPYDVNALGVLRFENGEYDDNFGKYPYHVDTVNKVIVWDTANHIGASLADVQNAKIAQLTDFQTQSNATFQSTALGTVHTYLSDEKAMGQFSGEYAFVNSTAYDNSAILWYTVEQGGVTHTVAQFNQAYIDGRKHLADNFAKWDSLVKQVNACTTVDQVNAISW